jgi:hypothetical protein
MKECSARPDYFLLRDRYIGETFEKSVCVIALDSEIFDKSVCSIALD